MFAPTPKTDIRRQPFDVRFVPIPDLALFAMNAVISGAIMKASKDAQ
jgi:hypothetical protein